MEKFREPSEQRERLVSPTEGLKEFLQTYSKIMDLLGWLVECGPGVDPAIVAMKRAQLNDLFQSLGLDPDDLTAMDTLAECHSDVMAHARSPQPTFEIPGVDFFEHRIPEVIRTRSSMGDDLVYPYSPTISEVADHAWTNWTSVQSHSDRTSTPQYIRDVAQIVADPIAYQLVFPRHDDDMQVTDTWEVANGGHRSLAVACLGSTAVLDANSWVAVDIAI